MNGKRFIASLHTICFLVFILPALSVTAQITVNNAVNGPDGVQNVLLGEGVTVSNITFSGNNAQIGSFNCAGTCNLGISSGIVMGSGNIDQVPGNGGGSTSLAPASGYGASDPDLVMLAGINSLNDAAVLQFDFVPTGDTLLFSFVFGSDEYPEWVSAGYNDAFGFFLSGPGISGPYSNNSKNIALLPNGITPVSIDNVNAGNNWMYYVNNNFVNSTNIECDGFTTVLTAFAQVQCGQTYHIKLAIADAGDTAYDSFVFLKAGSFQSNQLAMQFTAPNLAPAGGGVYEGCDTANLTFTRTSGITTTQVYNLQYSGTAVNGVDYQTLPSQLIFNPGQTMAVLPVTAIPDGVQEGTESFTITVLGTGCSNATSTINIGISDLPELQVTIPDVFINCGQQALLTPQISGGLGNYVVNWTASNQNTPTLSTYPSAPTSYNFVVSDTCGVTPFNGVANVQFIQNPPIVVDAGPDLQSTCLDVVSVTPAVSGGFGNYSYQWTLGNNVLSSNPNLTYTGSQNSTISLQVTDVCGATGSDSFSITYPAVPVVVELGSNLTVTCLDETTLTPDVSGGLGTYSYVWSTQAGQLGTAPSLSITTPETISIAVNVTDQCGNAATDQVILDVPQVSVLADLGPDLEVTCLDVTPVSVSTSGGVGQYTHQWLLNGNPVGNGTAYNVQVSQNSTLSYSVTDQCGNTTQDEINISVPPVPVTVDLGNDLFAGCSDQLPITANVQGGVGNYSFQWSSDAGSISGNSTANFQSLESSSVYVTVTDECGNTDSDQTYVEVTYEPIEIEITQDTTICKGNTVELTGVAAGGAGMLSYLWEETQQTTTSINVAPNYTSVYTFKVMDQCGSVAQESVTVTVYDIKPLFSAEYLDEDLIEFTNYTAGDVLISWNFNDGSTTNEWNPVHQFDPSNEWIVTLTASGATGCTKTVSQVYHPLGNLFVPNCFTPDNDGINDFFFVYGHDLRYFEIRIFNRDGQEIFYSNDINIPWDGSFKGHDHYVPDGAYNFRLKAIGKRENVIEKSGTILIIR